MATVPPDPPVPKEPWVPPRWFKRAAWRIHRWIYRSSHGRRGLRAPTAGRSGLLRIRAVGRTTGTERAVIVAYIEDGERFVTLAMNGWDDPEPQWWLNLQAQPDVVVDTTGGPLRVHARQAVGAERQRLWAALAGNEGWGGARLDGFAAHRSRETAVVVLEPRDA